MLLLLLLRLFDLSAKLTLVRIYDHVYNVDVEVVSSFLLLHLVTDNSAHIHLIVCGRGVTRSVVSVCVLSVVGHNHNNNSNNLEGIVLVSRW